MSASHCAPRLSGGTGLATCDQTSAGLNLLSPSIGVQGDSPAMPSSESFNSQQHFEIPLYTSDLGGTHWFDSPPFDNHASPPSENLKTVQEVNLLNPSFINQYGTQPGTFSRSSYPASDGITLRFLIVYIFLTCLLRIKYSSTTKLWNAGMAYKSEVRMLYDHIVPS